MKSQVVRLTPRSCNFHMYSRDPTRVVWKYETVFCSSLHPQTGEMEVKNPLFDDSTLHFQQLYKWARVAGQSEYSYNQLQWHTRNLVLSPALFNGVAGRFKEEEVGGASEFRRRLQCPQGRFVDGRLLTAGPIWDQFLPFEAILCFSFDFLLWFCHTIMTSLSEMFQKNQIQDDVSWTYWPALEQSSIGKRFCSKVELLFFIIWSHYDFIIKSLSKHLLIEGVVF